ncbi:MAG: hypothetical protein M0C28_16390 [Candidatus Moduliflexus flocculans]|nr:hypothetical protein [Candidatus Moduliflexus flocculans]
MDVNFVGFRASPALEAADRRTADSTRSVSSRPWIASRRTKCWRSLALDRFVFLFHDGASYPEADGFWVAGVQPRHRLGGLANRAPDDQGAACACAARWRMPSAFETPGQHVDD